MKILRHLVSTLFLLALAAPLAAQPVAPNDFAQYATMRLTADLSHLSAREKEALKEMIAASEIMDELFWLQSYGHRNTLKELTNDRRLLDYAAINYGPWDRLQGNRPFIPGVGEKPLGAQFYPADMTKEELEAAKLSAEKDLYSLIRRDAQGRLYSVPYNIAYKGQLEEAAAHIRKAAELVSEPQLRDYLVLRAEALLSNKYQASDMAWMDMKENSLDLVIGPIETYEDRLYGYRAAFESYVLVKDKKWSQKLAHYAQFLPELQRELPVAEKYKTETPGADSDLNAYDVVYYAGDCNAGSKTIAINLPNDEQVQLEKGSRRLQLKNAMQAKYDKIMLPIAEILLVPEQRSMLTFDAFFANTMFHEVAHGLGIKNVVGQDGQPSALTVKDALKELSGTIEEGKADLLGVFMIESLTKRGELPADELNSQYVTYMAGIFRSIRFGSSSAHGAANLVRFNFFAERGAFTRDPQSGRYRVDLDKMSQANNELTALTLKLQGDGDYEGAKAFMGKYGVVGQELQSDLERLKSVPTDIVFEQGVKVLGL